MVLESLTDPLKMEVLNPPGGKLKLAPWDWSQFILRMPVGIPAVPKGYNLNMMLEAKEDRSDEVIFKKKLSIR